MNLATVISRSSPAPPSPSALPLAATSPQPMNSPPTCLPLEATSPQPANSPPTCLPSQLTSPQSFTVPTLSQFISSPPSEFPRSGNRPRSLNLPLSSTPKRHPNSILASPPSISSSPTSYSFRELNITSHTDSIPNSTLLTILIRVEEKIDHLTKILNTNHCASPPPVTSVTCPSQTSEDTPSPSSSSSLALSPFIPSQSSCAVQPRSFQEQPDTAMDLARIKSQSSSHMNFSVRLLKIMFEPDELVGKNVQGMWAKSKLNPEKIATIKKLLIPILEKNTKPKSIDSYIGKVTFRSLLF